MPAYTKLEAYEPTQLLRDAPLSRVLAMCQLATGCGQPVIRSVLACGHDQPNSPARRRVIEWAVRSHFLQAAGLDAARRRETVRKVRAARRADAEGPARAVENLEALVDDLEALETSGEIVGEHPGHALIDAAVALHDEREALARARAGRA